MEEREERRQEGGLKFFPKKMLILFCSKKNWASLVSLNQILMREILADSLAVSDV